MGMLGLGGLLLYLALAAAVASATATTVSTFGTFVGWGSGLIGVTGTTTAPLALPLFGSIVTQTTVAGITTHVGTTAALGTANAILYGTMAVGGAGVVGGVANVAHKRHTFSELVEYSLKDDVELALGVENPTDADADA